MEDIEQEIARCDEEILICEVLLRSGDKAVEGLCLGLADWSNERRLLMGQL